MEMLTPNSLYKSVGLIKDAHGLKGELYVRLFAGKADWLEGFERALLVSPDEHEACEVHVVSAKPHKEGLILKVEDLDDRTPAEGLRGYKFLIPTDLLVSRPGEDVFLNELLGFQIVDATTGITSRIEGFAYNGAQDLILTKVDGEEKMIPLVRAFVEKMDFQKQVIHMRLPVGLLRDVE